MDALRVGIAFDLGRDVGAGHCVRSMALGAALRSNGAVVDVVADFSGYTWPLDLAHSLGLNVINEEPFNALVGHATSRKWDVVVVDSYRATPEAFRGLPAPLVAIDDLASRSLPAQIVVNQNLIAWECDYSTWNAAKVLRGPEFALLRPAVIAARSSASTPVASSSGRQRILVMLGGTDASGSLSRLTRAVLAVDLPLEVVVIAPSPRAEAELAEIEVRPDTVLTVTRPAPDIERHMVWADLVVTAAGSTVWESCCIGKPMAILVVAENQARNAELLVEKGIARPLGPDESTNTQVLTELLTDHSRLQQMAGKARELIDGNGAPRVANVIEAFCASRKERDHR